ncbi:MAG: M67 family metallopeptidase [Anaerolineales bacterium]|nr:M67 family metallopeptidase [Anaerolineales bacterium]
MMVNLRAPQELQMSQAHWETMHAAVAQQSPLEACGLLAGEYLGAACQVTAIIPTTNILRSPTRFQIDPQEQWQAFQHIEAQGWELVGVYHSHPFGPDEPSPSDVAQAYYPEAIHLIWSGKTGEWKCRGFLIQNGSLQEIALQISA